MIPLSVPEVISAVDGTTDGWAAAAVDQFVTGAVVHDSRLVREGDLFVAVIGETHDGHEYVADALAAGAVAAIVSSPQPGRTIEVADTVVALGRLAHAVLERATNTTVLAITGSSGKTSTKDLLAAVLSTDGPTVAPPGSFNNELGLPMTVLSIAAETKWLVLEMGSRGQGHIETLCEIAGPDVGVILNVGSAHLGEFGTAADIAVAKSELVAALAPAGIAVLNADDQLVAPMAERTDAGVIWFGATARADVQVVDIELDALARPLVSLRIRDQVYPVQLLVHGSHQAMNAAAVAASAIAVGLSPETIVAGLASATAASRWRMEVTRTADGVVVINDAYNANPESMAAALHALAAMGRDCQSWAVLGEMRELGDTSIGAHDQIGRLALRLGIDHVIGVGTAARPLVLGAASEGYFNGEAQFAADIEAAQTLLRQGVQPGDVVLLKASRAVGLERLADELIADHGGSAL